MNKYPFQRNTASIETDECFARSVDQKCTPIEDLFALKLKAIWKAFVAEGFGFWMACMYIFFEYVRPHSIWSWLDFYPYWARTFVVLAFLGWIFDSKRKFVWTRLTTGIFLFQFIIILSSINAYWPEISWHKFMDLFNWVVVYFILTQIVTTKHRFVIIILVFFVSSLKLSLFGARFVLTRGFTASGIYGPLGYFNNPGELAIQMIVFAPMAFYFVLGIKPYLTRWKARILYLVPVTALVTILGTNTRGGQLAVATQLLFLVIMVKRRLLILTCITLVLCLGYNILPDAQKYRFQSMGSDGTSIQRILYWKNGWEMIKKHPFLGVGYFNFPEYFEKNYSDDIYLDILQGSKAQLPHNIFIQVGTDAGFVGLSCFIFLIVSSFFMTSSMAHKARKSSDRFAENMSKGLNFALLGYVIAGQFVTVAYYPFLWIHLFFVSSLFVITNSIKSN